VDELEVEIRIDEALVELVMLEDDDETILEMISEVVAAVDWGTRLELADVRSLEDVEIVVETSDKSERGQPTSIQ
jgi:hypothetical protein